MGNAGLTGKFSLYLCLYTCYNSKHKILQSELRVIPASGGPKTKIQIL